VSAPPLRRALCLAYGAGSIGAGIFSTIPGLLLLFYLTDTLAVPAGLAGLAMLIPKLWDIITDPIVGAWSDRTRTRWGRRRPFLLAGALLLPPCFMALFMAPVGDPTVSFAWVLIAFCAAAGAFTLFQVPYATMPTEMTGDYHERTTLVAYRMAFVTVGILAAGALAPELIDAGGGGVEGYASMAVVLALVAMAAMLVAFFGTRGAAQSEAVASPLGLRAQLGVVLMYLPFRRLLAAYALQCVALGTVLAAVPYFVRYTLQAGNSGLTLLFVCLVAPAIVTMPGWTAVSRRYGQAAGVHPRGGDLRGDVAEPDLRGAGAAVAGRRAGRGAGGRLRGAAGVPVRDVAGADRRGRAGDGAAARGGVHGAVVRRREGGLRGSGRGW
jgi:GPH family glycoside/pentoside/hexuronide:cation symporter